MEIVIKKAWFCIPRELKTIKEEEEEGENKERLLEVV